ncbi:F-box protein At3g62230 [Lathyrus oleraceus]|uniref:F-box domain-containing protein n=1 Tax=Pisum sativum TaxID=3888 RepID=A0A9D4WWZ3_PEA|nr:F-box protein At3g62230-like [Pisum sativum]KAI5409452.1 hypothetical protein KIW84_055042 [Pisum sativum]
MKPDFDWISLLPNPLLFNIISLIPFKEAARTSILSKRWLHLWKHSTNIEFNEHYFSRSCESGHLQRIIQRRDFVKFILLWIENNKGDSFIEKFGLTLSGFDHESDREIIKTCVAFATQKGVKDLVLDFSDPDWVEDDIDKLEALFELPTEVYDHKPLRSLKLVSCRFVETELIKLSALKEVSLVWMKLKSNAIELLLSNCKMIESLTMKKCLISTKFECCGSYLSLKRIVVDSCKFIYAGFAINAPNLKYFKYYGNVIYFQMKNSLLMEEAELDFGNEYQFPENDGLIYNMVADFNHVKVLTLCSYTLQVLSNDLGPMLKEDEMNARHLKLKTNLHDDECHGVSFLLNSFPVLEHLTIDLGYGRFFDSVSKQYYFSKVDDGDQSRSWIDYLNIFPSLTSTLKIVEINNFRGTENEVLLLQFVINNGSLLQRINIKVQKEEVVMVENYRNIKEFVMDIPRASRDLEIYVC